MEKIESLEAAEHILLAERCLKSVQEAQNPSEALVQMSLASTHAALANAISQQSLVMLLQSLVLRRNGQFAVIRGQ